VCAQALGHNAPHPMPALRILLADDHRMVRAGLRALLEALPRVTVVGEADDGAQAEALIAKLTPDIAFVDIAMPVKDGLAVLRKFGDRGRTRIVMLTMHDTETYVVEAARNGAAGYLLKDAGVEELTRALDTLRAGGSYFSPRISGILARALARGPADSPALTGRQTEILRLIALGGSSRDIAQQLALSTKTIDTHRAQIMERVGVHDLAGLVRYALRIGLVSHAD
jgi:DNA-binding NarL/FixJ family response regulator